jgi:hypothetical protein
MRFYCFKYGLRCIDKGNENELSFKLKKNDLKGVLPCQSPFGNLFSNLLELKFQGTARGKVRKMLKAANIYYIQKWKSRGHLASGHSQGQMISQDVGDRSECLLS